MPSDFPLSNYTGYTGYTGYNRYIDDDFDYINDGYGSEAVPLNHMADELEFIFGSTDRAERVLGEAGIFSGGYDGYDYPGHDHDNLYSSTNRPGELPSDLKPLLEKIDKLTAVFEKFIPRKNLELGPNDNYGLHYVEKGSSENVKMEGILSWHEAADDANIKKRHLIGNVIYSDGKTELDILEGTDKSNDKIYTAAESEAIRISGGAGENDTALLNFSGNKGNNKPSKITITDDVENAAILLNENQEIKKVHKNAFGWFFRDLGFIDDMLDGINNYEVRDKETGKVIAEIAIDSGIEINNFENDSNAEDSIKTISPADAALDAVTAAMDKLPSPPEKQADSHLNDQVNNHIENLNNLNKITLRTKPEQPAKKPAEQNNTDPIFGGLLGM